MTEITFNLTDEMVKAYGIAFIKGFVEKQIQHLNALHTMDKIEKLVNPSDLDVDKELDSIRESAWQEYKKDFFN
jgi:hypothetical protein